MSLPGSLGPIALLVAAPFASAAACAPAGPLEISVTRSGDSALASYRLREPVACLALNDRGDVRKLSWQLQTAGARLSDDGNTVHFAAPRSDFTVRLRAFDHDGAIDRVYSPLIAFGDRTAVAVYTSYLYPASTQRGVTIAFDGFAPTASQRAVGPQRIGIEQTYIVVGQPTIVRRGTVAAVIDQAMPAWLLRRVDRAIAQGERALQEVSRAARPLTYLVTYTEPATPTANWRGDTLDTLVRLNFMGAPWRQDGGGYRDTIDEFILHELFHTAISPVLNPHLPGAMTLSEGGAEAGAAAMRRNFTVPVNDGGVDEAIASCQQLGGDTLADKEQQSQRSAPYQCGKALQFMIAAAAQRDPLDLWSRLLRTAKPFDAGWPSLFAAAAADNPRAKQPALAILGQMAASQTGWNDGIAQLLTLGLLRRRSEAELALPAFTTRFRTAAIFHLLKQTCRQSYGFNTESAVYLLDAPAGTCGAAPDKFPLVVMNGIKLDADAYRAYHELARRCTAGMPVTLTGAHGEHAELACSTAPPEVVVYTLLP